jgi:hypothetical protein
MNAMKLKRLVAKGMVAGGLGLTAIGFGAGVANADPPSPPPVPTPPPVPAAPAVPAVDVPPVPAIPPIPPIPAIPQQ